MPSASPHRVAPLTVAPRPALLALLLTGACGGGSDAPVLASPDGVFRVVFQADAAWKQDRAQQEMQSALARFPDLDLVFGHNDPMAFGARTAADRAGREGILFVGIDALPSEGRRYVEEGRLDATVEYPTGGAEAVDLALLAIAGIELPKDIVLGTRLWTRDNLAAGGEDLPGSGSTTLDELRRAHPDVVTTEPRTDEVRTIGMAQCTTDEPWRVRMDQDIRDAVARYPQLELDIQSADDRIDRQQALVREFIAKGHAAILISPKESMALARVAKDAREAGIPVIILDRKLGTDDYTCFIGGDNLAIGRAAGRAIREMLGPDGGAIVELQGLMTSSPAQERHRGFVEALGLQAPGGG